MGNWRNLLLVKSIVAWITCGTSNFATSQESFPTEGFAGTTSHLQNPNQPQQESNAVYSEPANSLVFPASPETFLTSAYVAVDAKADTSAGDSPSSERPSDDAPKLDEKKETKTLEERFADLEKFYKKDKEAAVKKKEEEAAKKAADAKKEKKWFEKYTIRGYAQVRYNEVISREDPSAPPQYVGDRSVSEDQTFFLRRARLIISGDVSDHMAIYLQPDFASTPDGSTGNIHFAQIRDWYADCFVDKTKVHRFRVGQSKIPYGWENMQSSSNRLVLDRNDALNSALRNERDFGVIYYWTPEPAQEFFTAVNDKGLKGSGNYGVFGLGAYAGQGGSLAEQNDNLHIVSRLHYRWNSAMANMPSLEYKGIPVVIRFQAQVFVRLG